MVNFEFKCLPYTRLTSEKGYLSANNMDFKSKYVPKSFSQCYLHAHIYCISSFLGLQFEQYTRVAKMAKAVGDISKNMDP